MRSIEDVFGYAAGRANYLTHISEKHRAVFVEVPKAGCTAVKRILQYSELDGAANRLPDDVHRRQTSPLLMPTQHGDLEATLGASSSYRRFAFIRNPFSRALSCYLDKIVGSQWERDLRLPLLGFKPDAHVSFREFLDRVADQRPADMDIHWAPQAHLLALDSISYDFLGRFESFGSDIRRVMAFLGVNVPDQLVTERTKHATNASEKMRQYYSHETVELVRVIYREDFRRLGYGREPLLA